MLSAGVRRISILVAILLSISCYALWKSSNPPETEERLKPKMVYKVRAYATSKEQADKILEQVEMSGQKGSVIAGTRTINKLMGYTVIQDFAKSEDPRNIDYINEFLNENGIKSQIIENPDGKTLSIRVGGHYPDEKSAREIADKVKKISTVSFKIEKYFKEVPFKAFIVVFQDIDGRRKALEIKKIIEVICSDVEVVSY